MKLGVVTIFPEMFTAVSGSGITRSAMESGAIDLVLFNPRDYCHDRYRAVDDRPYGGGPGMVLKPEPMARCIDDARSLLGGPVVYMTPQGVRLDQDKVRDMSELPSMILLAGRYEGIDERIVQSRVDMEISIGDYVLSGGEIPAMVMIDAMTRLLPGVLGNELSAEQDSFADGRLDYPHYTRPEEFEGRQVPEVLLSGDHERIRLWRSEQSRMRTLERRPDLVKD